MCVFWNKYDKGAGTLLGILIVLLIGFLMSAALSFSQYVIQGMTVRMVSDVAAISAAYANYQYEKPACQVAKNVVEINRMVLKNCLISGEDVIIEVENATKTFIFPKQKFTSKAGPAPCGDKS
ncbi:MAG: flp pilus-assembly TadE/G-like family protein [Bifidobacteriaceae bacterium]|nr:flp pilus-assembly TadE/G-like family protein [Bifidobacteriaceae bacterium]